MSKFFGTLSEVLQKLAIVAEASDELNDCQSEMVIGVKTMTDIASASSITLMNSSLPQLFVTNPAASYCYSFSDVSITTGSWRIKASLALVRCDRLMRLNRVLRTTDGLRSIVSSLRARQYLMRLVRPETS